jgi:anti-sigma factor RsiW
MTRRPPRKDPMACEAVRPLLPELAEGVPHEAGAVEAHIAGCRACSAELDRYRALIEAMGGLREVAVEAPDGFLEAVLSDVLPASQGLGRLHRVAAVATNPRVVLSVGGAVVGATAIGLLWWRTARRGMPEERAVGSVLASL